MNSYNDSILLKTIETPQEKIFNHKCETLLSFYNKDKAVTIASQPNFLENKFVNDYLSRDDINHILLKKYYICEHKQNPITNALDNYLNALYFDQINLFLHANTAFRKELLEVYINNKDIPNTVLAIEKTAKLGYDRVNSTLRHLDNFYSTIKSQKKDFVLRKSYK